jgi:hypothetical protein
MADVQMQAFVTPVILGASRTTPFQIDTQSQPPCRKPREA